MNFSYFRAFFVALTQRKPPFSFGENGGLLGFYAFVGLVARKRRDVGNKGDFTENFELGLLNGISNRSKAVQAYAFPHFASDRSNRNCQN